MDRTTFWIRVSGVLGFFSVALGAFGAHAFKDRLMAMDLLSGWNTAVLYHFLHALAIAIFAQAKGRSRYCLPAFLAGILLFSGSLYLMPFVSARWLGPITPLGGLCFLFGWFMVTVGSGRPQNESAPASPAPATAKPDDR